MKDSVFWGIAVLTLLVAALVIERSGTRPHSGLMIERRDTQPQPSAPARPPFCARWQQAGTEDPRLQTVAMLENINQLDGSTVDSGASCVRSTRWCAGPIGSARGMVSVRRVFAFSFVREARSRCP